MINHTGCPRAHYATGVNRCMVGYCRLSVRRDVALVKYMVLVLRGELHHPVVLAAALRLRVPNDYLGARRHPALLEVPTCRTNLLKTVDVAVCTEDSGAARLEAVLVALVERKARALHAEHARHSRTHPLLLLLRHLPDEEASIIGTPSEDLPSHWCEHEIARHKRRKLRLQAHRSREQRPEQLEREKRRRRRRRRSPDVKPRKHRTLLVSAIDEQAKVIHVLDPDELPRRARYTIMVTACLLLFLCLLLVGVTLRMAPLIDDMDGTKMDAPEAAPGPVDEAPSPAPVEGRTRSGRTVRFPDYYRPR